MALGAVWFCFSIDMFNKVNADTLRSEKTQTQTQTQKKAQKQTQKQTQKYTQTQLAVYH